MSVTFQTLIQHNKRNSTFLVLALVALTAFVCGLFTIVLSGADLSFPAEVIHRGYKNQGPTFHDWMLAFPWSSFFTGASIGAVIACAGSLFSYYFGNSMIALMSNAAPLDYATDPQLHNVVSEMAIAAGVPMPKIYLIPDSSPNAFATGRDPKHALIGITQGLRDKLTRDELQAVVAHEMAHIKNLDIRLMMLVGVFAGMVVLLSDFFVRRALDRVRFRSSRSNGNGAGGAFMLIAFLVGLVVGWLAPIIARVIQYAVSREREYLADATAVQFCRNPLALASALKKIALDPEPLARQNRALEHMYIINPSPERRLTRADFDSVFSTHPPTIKRIIRLRQIAGETAAWPESTEAA